MHASAGQGGKAADASGIITLPTGSHSPYPHILGCRSDENLGNISASNHCSRRFRSATVLSCFQEAHAIVRLWLRFAPSEPTIQFLPRRDDAAHSAEDHSPRAIASRRFSAVRVAPGHLGRENGRLRRRGVRCTGEAARLLAWELAAPRTRPPSQPAALSHARAGRLPGP